MLSGTLRRSDFMTNGWMNRASDHGKAVPAGAYHFPRETRIKMKSPPPDKRYTDGYEQYHHVSMGNLLIQCHLRLLIKLNLDILIYIIIN
jgi:hypothetical protein